MFISRQKFEMCILFIKIHFQQELLKCIITMLCYIYNFNLMTFDGLSINFS